MFRRKAFRRESRLTIEKRKIVYYARQARRHRHRQYKIKRNEAKLKAFVRQQQNRFLRVSAQVLRSMA